MARRSLSWTLFPGHWAVALFVLAAVAFVTLPSHREQLLETEGRHVESRARSIAARAAVSFGEAAAGPLPCEELRASDEVTIVDAGGRVTCGDDLTASERPEVRAALDGRLERRVDDGIVAVAAPVTVGDRTVAAVRVERSLTDVTDAMTSAHRQLLVAGIAATALCLLLAFVTSRRIARSLTGLRRAAEALGDGDLDHRVPSPTPTELADVADALNRMALRLDERVRAITRAKDNRDAVLSSMTEGVVAIDSDERVISINDTAARILNAGGEEPAGRRLQELVRNPDLARFCRRIMESAEPLEEEIVLRDPGERILEVHGAPLREASSATHGAVVVFTDVTRLRRLESVRREFVANVSHELKTPVTSIKGFVETLQDGALEDGDKATRFLDIIQRQSDRLNAIIEDLLMLSRLEQDDEAASITVRPFRVKPILGSAIQACQVKASDKQVRLELECPEQLRVRVNGSLIEQAVVNLVDNAIKSSEPDSRIDVRARHEQDELVIEVADEGCGIATEHLPNLFTRFYRVDKARSRKEGGTGLGLAIVKHVVQAHQGTTEVSSVLGEGSTFRIRLPLRNGDGDSDSEPAESTA